MTLEEMINKLRNMPIVEVIQPELIDHKLVTDVEPPFAAKVEVIETEFILKIPEQILEFWTLCSSLHLLVDKQRFSRGLHTYPPNEELIKQNRKHFNGLIDPDDQLPGDLILGEIEMEQDKLIVRCDPSSHDFGELLIAIPITSRKNWPRMGNSLVKFLQEFIDHNGDTYWA